MRTRVVIIGIVFFLGCMAVQAMQAAQVRLAWNAPVAPVAIDEDDPYDIIAGYKVYVGTASGQYTSHVDSGPEQSFILRDLDPHSTYYIAVKAYDWQGVMSADSEEIAWVFDASGNGLPDAWEEHFFGVAGELSNGFDADYSGNGFSNGASYIAGTDPTDPSDVPTMDVRSGPNGEVQLLIESRLAMGAGYLGLRRRYAIDNKDDLRSESWEVLPGYGAIDATGQTLEISDVTESVMRFYRFRTWLEQDEPNS